MSLWDRLRGSAGGGRSAEVTGYLRDWAGARTGVEAFVEPRTMVTETTVLFVAQDGEWTRRRVSSPEAAKKLARSLRIPIYDVQLVGYPRRMRDYDARRRVSRERDRREDLEG